MFNHPLRHETQLVGAVLLSLLMGLSAKAETASGEARTVQPAGVWVRSGSAGARNVTDTRADKLENITVRQSLRLTLGGDAVQVRVSNQYGSKPLVIGEASVRVGGGQIRPVRFSGQARYSVPPGAIAVSDPVAVEIAPLSVAEVSLYLPEATAATTMRRDPKNLAQFSSSGNYVQIADMPVVSSSAYSPFVTGIDVHTPTAKGTIVALGDSITDPDCTFDDRLCRWSDVLAERLIKGGKPYAVANAGISGNRILTDGTGPSVLARFERDVLSVPQATHLIVLVGINDIGASGPGRNGAADTPLASCEDMVAGYRQMIVRAHVHGIKVYGAEILPFAGAGYFSPDKDAVRLCVNEWIRTSNAFDALIDFSAAVADPANRAVLATGLQTGDNLHPNPAGQRAMGQIINLGLFD
ncbi:SGNH/GDSL hydrolase family protein [Asticcacaulis machinosus]|uniref:SGNH/GDSL hydrolase family protein n=1 Tax=Asticcacaulis machinosus TaxID=2984211 RepID=A0ABT5HH54_9CAUL|nr:SGNH/GDSL hydrolase family protein [Asticcacaulis machinosus]MDC7675586.1 SGNH/GDSL hydrolase family protein [Asticcacaulis machinosus]